MRRTVLIPFPTKWKRRALFRTRRSLWRHIFSWMWLSCEISVHFAYSFFESLCFQLKKYPSCMCSSLSVKAFFSVSFFVSFFLTVFSILFLRPRKPVFVCKKKHLFLPRIYFLNFFEVIFLKEKRFLGSFVHHLFVKNAKHLFFELPEQTVSFFHFEKNICSTTNAFAKKNNFVQISFCGNFFVCWKKSWRPACSESFLFFFKKKSASCVFLWKFLFTKISLQKCLVEKNLWYSLDFLLYLFCFREEKNHSYFQLFSMFLASSFLFCFSGVFIFLSFPNKKSLSRTFFFFFLNMFLFWFFGEANYFSPLPKKGRFIGSKTITWILFSEKFF